LIWLCFNLNCSQCYRYTVLSRTVAVIFSRLRWYLFCRVLGGTGALRIETYNYCYAYVQCGIRVIIRIIQIIAFVGDILLAKQQHAYVIIVTIPTYINYITIKVMCILVQTLSTDNNYFTRLGFKTHTRHYSSRLTCLPLVNKTNILPDSTFRGWIIFYWVLQVEPYMWYRYLHIIIIVTPLCIIITTSMTKI